MRDNIWGDTAVILTDAANALLEARKESGGDGAVSITCWGNGPGGTGGLQAAWQTDGSECAVLMQLGPDGKWQTGMAGDAQAEADLLAEVLKMAEASVTGEAETNGDAADGSSLVLRIRVETGGTDRLLMLGETVFEILQPAQDRRIEIVCSSDRNGARALTVQVESPEGRWRGTLTVDGSHTPALVSEWLPDGEQSAPAEDSRLARLVADITLTMDYVGTAACAS